MIGYSDMPGYLGEASDETFDVGPALAPLKKFDWMTHNDLV